MKFNYITAAENDRIIARISSIHDPEEREMATVAAMRRFIAGTQPLGGKMILVDCPTRHQTESDFDLNGIIVSTDGLPGGTPERYNIYVPFKKSGKGKVRGFKPHEEEAADDASFKLVVQVEPKYMRTVPIKHDYADRFHEKIPEDHKADEWFDARVARYEENLPMLIALGGPRGPKRPT